MSPTFTESGWEFDFDDELWPAVLKWDEDDTFVKAQQRLAGNTMRSIKGCGRQGCRWTAGRTDVLISESTRAVDFAAVGPGDRPYLIEVKRLRGGGLFESVDERAFKIASKVRDSLSGIAFARARVGTIPDPDLTQVRKRLRASSTVKVVVFFEHAGSPAQEIALRKRLEPLLSGWLRGEVAVVGPNALIPGLAVS